MYNDNSGRASGRTTRMLLKAMLAFLEGNNVIVFAYRRDYAASLCCRVMDMLYAARITKDVIRNGRTITFNGYKMVFEKPISLYNAVEDCGEAKIFEDHYWSNE